MPRTKLPPKPPGSSAGVAGDPLVRHFVQYLEGDRNASPRTVRNYLHGLAQFRAYAPGKTWKQADAEDFRGFLFDRMKRGLGNATIRVQFSGIRAFYTFLAKRGEIPVNPLHAVGLPKTTKSLPSFLTLSQIEQLLSAPRRAPKQKQAPAWMVERDIAILECFYSAGMRLSELAGLNVEDVDAVTDVVRVLGKGRKERLCPIGPEAAEAIQRYRHAANVRAGPLFLNKSRRRLSPRSIWLLVKKYVALEKLPVGISPHKLRHTYATHLLDGGADLRSLQSLLGHANLSTTQIYTHLTTERLKKIYDASHPRA